MRENVLTQLLRQGSFDPSAFDAETIRFLDTITKDNTKRSFTRGLKLFQEFYQKPAFEFVAAVDADKRLPLKQRKFVDRDVLVEFVKFLKKKAAVKGEEKAWTGKTLACYAGGIQALASFYDVDISLKHIGMPSSSVTYKKHPWSLEKIGAFISLMDSKMYRAITGCTFQSGLSLVDLFSFEYGDIAEELESGIEPLCFDLIRQKTETPHLTFIGHDALVLLRDYLKDVRLGATDKLFNTSIRSTDDYLFLLLRSFCLTDSISGILVVPLP